MHREVNGPSVETPRRFDVFTSGHAEAQRRFSKTLTPATVVIDPNTGLRVQVPKSRE
jgi:hypothetical protein